MWHPAPRAAPSPSAPRPRLWPGDAPQLYAPPSGRAHPGGAGGAEARGAPDGERKTITALFADIKGSMALLEDLDPEEARRIIDPALQLMMDAVHRYEGYVDQSLGDGIFALFGGTHRPAAGGREGAAADLSGDR